MVCGMDDAVSQSTVCNDLQFLRVPFSGKQNYYHNSACKVLNDLTE